MQANETFSYLNQGQLESSGLTVMQLYYPLMKADAYLLYQYFQAFYDHGRKEWAVSDILNHLLFALPRFEEALGVLTALDLVRFYKAEQTYLIELVAPLSREDFLQHSVYRHLLEQTIGKGAVAELLPMSVEAKPLSKRFSEVFGVADEIPSPKKESMAPKVAFDLEHFKQLMARDGLRFTDEKADVLGLISLSERFKLTWYDCYQLAKETASQHRINLERMLARKEQAPSSNETFSEKEQIILQEAKSVSAPVFLAKMKKPRQAVVTRDEQKVLAELADMGLLDEVINIMIIYTMNKTQSVNLQKNYILKLANDFKHKKIIQAETAMVQLRGDKRSKAATKPKAKATNIPSWSNSQYQNETSAETKEALEARRQQMLARLKSKKGED